MVKFNKIINKEKELKNKLAELDETGITIYYESLLKKCLRQLKKMII